MDSDLEPDLTSFKREVARTPFLCGILHIVHTVALGQLLYVQIEHSHLFALLLLLEGKVEAEALDSAGDTPLAELFPPDELVLLTANSA